MGYQRNVVPAIHGSAGLLTVEQARKRNAELHMELRHLEAAGDALIERVASARRILDDQLAEAKAELAKARDRLTNVIKATDAARIQAEHIKAANSFVSRLPPPIHGGREGLEAATREMEEHESAGLKLKKVIPPKGPSHGTGRRYGLGCRCDQCRSWCRDRTDRRRSRKKAQALEAAA